MLVEYAFGEHMRRKATILLFLAMFGIFGAVGVVHAVQKPSVVHFVVITDRSSGVNYAQEIPAFERELCRLAGGYTALGDTRGGFLSQASIIRESGRAYLVSARRNVAREVRDYVKEHFGEEPFILFWTAEQFDLE